MKKIGVLAGCVACAMAWISSFGAEDAASHVLPESEYPYWGEYKQTKFEDVRPAEWVADVHALGFFNILPVEPKAHDRY